MPRPRSRYFSSLGSKAALFNTTATAVDIDRIRSALGQPTLTYLGWSYGAKLGAEYARLYPDKVRAAGREGEEDSNAADAGLVINCNDSAPGPTEAEIKAAGLRFAKQFPLFGVWGSWHLFGCAFWQPPRHALQPPVAATAHPIVVVGTRHDSATPYSGAVAMATSLGTATLLTWEGQGHGAVGRNDCVTGHVANYLVSLTVPPQNTLCPA